MSSHSEDAWQAVKKCAIGALLANMALMQLGLHALTHGAAQAALADAIEQADEGARERLLEIQSLWRELPDIYDLIQKLVQTEAISGDDGIARCAVGFDAAAQLSPAASVALYSLGREDILDKATAEVVDELRNLGLLGRDRSALQIGCGIGRFLAALAPELSRVVGLDVFHGMLAQARSRCAGRENVELLLGEGRGFSSLPDACFDLVLAVDSFPYLVAAGADIVKSNFAEIRRVLLPKGRLLIFNYSYRGRLRDRGGTRSIGTRPFRPCRSDRARASLPKQLGQL